MKHPQMYVGADVHSKSTTFAVLDAAGALVMESTVRTDPTALVAAIGGIPGSVSLTFEEGCQSNWLWELLRPHVARLVVCDPRHNKLITSGNKSDAIDARKLAELLRGNHLKSVYKAASLRQLRELCTGYDKLVTNRTRAMNRLKAIFRGRGIETTVALYDRSLCEHWLGQLPRTSLRWRALWLYDELDTLDRLVAEAEAEMRREARKHTAYKLLITVPGIGKIRAAQLLGLLQSPHRFRTRSQLWAYAGLAVVTKTSADFAVVGGRLVRTHKKSARGLNRNGNRRVKTILKGAAQYSAHQGAYVDEFKERIGRGQRADHIKLTFARRIATLCLAVWKKGEPYDPKYAADKS